MVTSEIFKHLNVLFIAIQVIATSINYQSGYSLTWASQNFGAGSTQDQTISFSSQFAKVPQVAINPVIHSFNRNSAHTEIGYQLSITSITTSNFIVRLYVSTGTATFLSLSWIAVDDQRIEILCNFNIANPQSVNLTHNNPNAQKGIIFYTSYYAYTSIDFTLSLGDITTTTVKVNIVQSTLYNLGYIVILGPSDFLDIEAQILQPPKDKTDADVYKSRVVTKQTNKVWLFYFQYFSFVFTKEIKLQLEPTFTGTTSQYVFNSWDQTSGSYSQCAHQCATLNFELSEFTPLLFENLRISSMSTFASTNLMELSIPQLSKKYASLTSNDYVLVPNTFSNLIFIFTIRCDTNYKISAQLYQCVSCQTQYRTFVRQCFSSDLSLSFYSRYAQQTGAYQQIFLTMTASQVQIYQKVTNQISETILIGQFSIQ